MGIRKHFEKKSLDEDLKLQDLSLEQEKVKPELKFDPETEITEDDWRGMRRNLDVLRAWNDWWKFDYLAADMKILQPDESAKLNIDDQAWQEMKNILENACQHNDWQYIAEHAMRMKILQPDKFAELKIDDQAWWEGMKQILGVRRRGGSTRDFVSLAMRMKILRPDRFAELEIDDQAWQEIKEDLEMHRKERWYDFARYAMRVKIIQPDRFDEFEIDDQTWQRMMEHLEIDREDKSWLNFADQAMHMKILAADKVEVTDRGLKITMLPLESFKSEKKPRPERRQF